MELFQDLPRQRVFDSLSGFIPKSFDEYNSVIGKAAADIAELYNITEITYRFSPPEGIYYPNIREQNIVLFSCKKRAEDKPVLFSYPFETGGKIEFSVYMSAGSAREEIRTLEIIVRQFYYILSLLDMHLLHKEFLLTDSGAEIPNVNAFIDFGNKLAQRGEAGNYTALYFNIHNFRSVNKTLTYPETNKIIEQYYHIVANAVTVKEMAAYLGGDNFVALILNSNKDYFFDLIRNMVIKYKKGGRETVFLFGATIGAASLCDEKDAGEIMMRANAAYQSARENRTSFSYYDRNTSLELLERKIILSRFPNAIREREFFAVYQPKVSAKTHAIIGAEALVRWNHEGGCIMPASFIPVFEKDGCVTVLDFYMLEETCAFLSKLRSKGIELIKISVNFSKRHLSNNKLVEEIVEVIDRYKIPHEYIEIELTEGENYHNNAIMKEVVDDLNFLGIKTSIDDFGTGYSSLSMLKNLRLDTLKIDRSFIPQNEPDRGDKSYLMLKGVVNLAKSLGVTIVAEGVETVEQLRLIENMNCDIVQGYLFDKPLTEDEFIERLKQKVYIIDEK